jgi:hypothetical protein
MSQYLLSVHTVAGEAASPPMAPEEMRAVMECVQALETEMKSSGTFVFGGRLHDPETATVVRRGASAARRPGPDTLGPEADRGRPPDRACLHRHQLHLADHR